MPTKFILDKNLKEQQKLIEKITNIIKNRPDEKTQILGTFVSYLFQVNQPKEDYIDKFKQKEDLELELIKRKEMESLTKKAPKPSYAGAYEEIKSVPKIPKPKTIITPNKKPIPPAPKPKYREEYIIPLKSYPIGVLIESQKYNLIEPQVDEALINTTKKLIANKIDRVDSNNFKIFVERAAKRTNTKFNPTQVKKVKYYLKKENGFGKLNTLLQDNKIKEIKVENNNIKIKHENFSDELDTNLKFTSKEEIDALMNQISKIINVKFTNTITKKYKDLEIELDKINNKIIIKRLG